MPTTKSRINISLPDDIKKALVMLAHKDQVPTATKAGRLLEIGLELEEDQLWDQIASRRDTQKASFVSHTKAFNV